MAIEQLRLGMRVLGENPEGDAVDSSMPEPDPATWRRIVFASDDDGLRIELLRPAAAISALGWKVGAERRFDADELHFSGMVRVLAIGPCPEVEPGEGAVVTGRYLHAPVAGLWSLVVEGSEQPIIGTSNHLFWSETRQEWVALGDLAIGETVLPHAGPALVTASAPVPGRQPVVNLEVHRQHVYHVGEQGALPACGTPTAVHRRGRSGNSRRRVGGANVRGRRRRL